MIARRLLAFAGLLIAVTSCSPASPLALYARPSSGEVFEAQLAGTMIQSNRCLFIRTGDGVDRLLAWPYPGTTWDGASRQVISDGIVISVGDFFTSTGGEFMTPTANSEWVKPPADGCWRDRMWVVGRVQLPQPR